MGEDDGFKAGPEGGLEDNKPVGHKMAPRQRKIMENIIICLVTCIWFGINAYVLYGFCYNVLWHHVRPYHQKPAIAILVLVCWLNLHAMISFIAIHWYGPGKINADYSRPVESQLDQAFLCDQDGYQLYCSYCKRVKPNRTHHSVHTDSCVPVMDHFCPWVGTVIGQGNYKFFLQYLCSAAFALIIVIVTLLVFQHMPLPEINGNSIALYIVAGGCLLFITVLFIQHCVYVLLSQTTLEHMNYRRSPGPYFNILWRPGQRRVVQASPREIMIPHASPYTQGYWSNITTVMGPVYTWLLPIRSPIHEPIVGEQFLKKMRAQLDEIEKNL